MNREEISEGLEDRIKLAFILYKKFLETKVLPRGFRTDYELVYDILSYLHSQGVVIQTGRGLPVTDDLISWSDVANRGYVAVEPLVEEGK